MSKRELTKARLRDAALRFFGEQGYEATTAEQIAAECGVSTMTFFRHFPSKDLTVLDDPYDPFIGASIAAQPHGLSMLERARRGLLEAWTQLPEPEHDDQRARVRIIARTPELRAKVWERNALTREVIVRELVADTADTGEIPGRNANDAGTNRRSVDRLRAESAAGACLGALEAALLDWGLSEDGTLGQRVALALEVLAPQASASDG